MAGGCNQCPLEFLETSREKTRAPEHSQLELRLSVRDVWLLKQQRALVTFWSWNAGCVSWVWCPGCCDSCPEAAGCIQICREAGAEKLLTPLLAWACCPALTGSGHSLTHPVPPVQELLLLTCPRLPLGCVQVLQGICSALGCSPCCLPSSPALGASPDVVCGSWLQKQAGDEQKCYTDASEGCPAPEIKASRAGGCCLHTEGGNVGAVVSGSWRFASAAFVPHGAGLSTAGSASSDSRMCAGLQCCHLSVGPSPLLAV